MIEWLTQDVVTMLEAVRSELGNLLSPEWYRQNAVALFNVIMIDVVLAGDNAIIVGLAASRVAPELRSRVIFWGIAGAVLLRVAFASVAMQLLAIVGLTLAGGLLLLFVSWEMYRQITGKAAAKHGALDAAQPGQEMGFWRALWMIIFADLSMSLDNVLAVAGAAKGSPLVLLIGLAVAIVLMALASRLIADLLVSYPWITWIGLLIIVWVALDMIYAGSHEVLCRAKGVGCDEQLLHWIARSLGLT